MELMETIQASFDHLTRENPMGEARKDALRLDFDRKLKVEFNLHGMKALRESLHTYKAAMQLTFDGEVKRLVWRRTG